MHYFGGFTLGELASIAGLLTFAFGGCATLIRYFRRSISEPMTLAIQELREDLNESRDQREKNEGKIFDTLENQQKQIYDHVGRITVLETITNSSVMRIDRAEKEIKGE